MHDCHMVTWIPVHDCHMVTWIPVHAAIFSPPQAENRLRGRRQHYDALEFFGGGAGRCGFGFIQCEVVLRALIRGGRQ